MMNNKVFIDLNGVVFEPVDDKFTKVARSKYGFVKGSLVALAYKYRIGNKIMKDSVASVLYSCAKEPVVRKGALDAVAEIAQIPNTTIEFFGRVAFPGQETVLERKYRAIAPCMDVATHYELTCPYSSNRDYLRASTAADDNSQNYIVGIWANDLKWPTRWRIMPVFIDEAAKSGNDVYRFCAPRRFSTLNDFSYFLAHHR